MRLGLVTDIHNQRAELSRALELFRTRDVEQVVTIGDTCDVFAPPDGADDVASLLSESGAIGVWGNHDFHLGEQEVSECCRGRFDQATLEFMQQMKPHLEIDGCYFSHKEASVDPYDVEQLWEFDEENSDLNARAAAGFRAISNRRQFLGHYHRWWATTPSGPLDWDGSGPLLLHPSERYFVVLAGVFQGQCAVFDTQSGILEPLDCASR
jgi:hypothetical protein